MTSDKKILHHGLCKEEIEPQYIGTDYFRFIHKDCPKEESHHIGHCRITKILIDNNGRVIFNLQCGNCGFIDALKTSAALWRSSEKREPSLKETFQLSPKLEKCIAHHKWDDI